MNAKRGRGRPKKENDTPIKENMSTPSNSSKKTVFTPCRRMGLGRKKILSSSPVPVQISNDVTTPPVSTPSEEHPDVSVPLQHTPSTSAAVEEKPKSTTSRRKKSSRPLKRTLDDSQNSSEGNSTFAVLISPVYKKQKLELVDIFSSGNPQDLPRHVEINSDNLIKSNSQSKVIGDSLDDVKPKNSPKRDNKTSVKVNSKSKNINLKTLKPVESDEQFNKSPTKILQRNVKSSECNELSFKNDTYFSKRRRNRSNAAEKLQDFNELSEKNQEMLSPDKKIISKKNDSNKSITSDDKVYDFNESGDEIFEIYSPSKNLMKKDRRVSKSNENKLSETIFIETNLSTKKRRTNKIDKKEEKSNVLSVKKPEIKSSKKKKETIARESKEILDQNIQVLSSAIKLSKRRKGIKTQEEEKGINEFNVSTDQNLLFSSPEPKLAKNKKVKELNDTNIKIQKKKLVDIPGEDTEDMDDFVLPADNISSSITKSSIIKNQISNTTDKNEEMNEVNKKLPKKKKEIDNTSETDTEIYDSILPTDKNQILSPKLSRKKRVLDKLDTDTKIYKFAETVDINMQTPSLESKLSKKKKNLNKTEDTDTITNELVDKNKRNKKLIDNVFVTDTESNIKLTNKNLKNLTGETKIKRGRRKQTVVKNNDYDELITYDETVQILPKKVKLSRKKKIQLNKNVEMNELIDTNLLMPSPDLKLSKKKKVGKTKEYVEIDNKLYGKNLLLSSKLSKKKKGFDRTSEENVVIEESSKLYDRNLQISSPESKLSKTKKDFDKISEENVEIDESNELYDKHLLISSPESKLSKTKKDFDKTNEENVEIDESNEFYDKSLLISSRESKLLKTKKDLDKTNEENVEIDESSKLYDSKLLISSLESKLSRTKKDFDKISEENLEMDESNEFYDKNLLISSPESKLSKTKKDFEKTSEENIEIVENSKLYDSNLLISSPESKLSKMKKDFVKTSEENIEIDENNELYDKNLLISPPKSKLSKKKKGFDKLSDKSIEIDDSDKPDEKNLPILSPEAELIEKENDIDNIYEEIEINEFTISLEGVVIQIDNVLNKDAELDKSNIDIEKNLGISVKVVSNEEQLNDNTIKINEKQEFIETSEYSDVLSKTKSKQKKVEGSTLNKDKDLQEINKSMDKHLENPFSEHQISENQKQDKNSSELEEIVPVFEETLEIQAEKTIGSCEIKELDTFSAKSSLEDNFSEQSVDKMSEKDPLLENAVKSNSKISNDETRPIKKRKVKEKIEYTQNVAENEDLEELIPISWIDITPEKEKNLDSETLNVESQPINIEIDRKIDDNPEKMQIIRKTRSSSQDSSIKTPPSKTNAIIAQIVSDFDDDFDDDFRDTTPQSKSKITIKNKIIIESKSVEKSRKLDNPQFWQDNTDQIRQKTKKEEKHKLLNKETDANVLINKAKDEIFDQKSIFLESKLSLDEDNVSVTRKMERMNTRSRRKLINDLVDVKETYSNYSVENRKKNKTLENIDDSENYLKNNETTLNIDKHLTKIHHNKNLDDKIDEIVPENTSADNFGCDLHNISVPSIHVSEEHNIACIETQEITKNIFDLNTRQNFETRSPIREYSETSSDYTAPSFSPIEDIVKSAEEKQYIIENFGKYSGQINEENRFIDAEINYPTLTDQTIVTENVVENREIIKNKDTSETLNVEHDTEIVKSVQSNTDNNYESPVNTESRNLTPQNVKDNAEIGSDTGKSITVLELTEEIIKCFETRSTELLNNENVSILNKEHDSTNINNILEGENKEKVSERDDHTEINNDVNIITLKHDLKCDKNSLSLKSKENIIENLEERSNKIITKEKCVEKIVSDNTTQSIVTFDHKLRSISHESKDKLDVISNKVENLPENVRIFTTKRNTRRTRLQSITNETNYQSFRWQPLVVLERLNLEEYYAKQNTTNNKFYGKNSLSLKKTESLLENPVLNDGLFRKKTVMQARGRLRNEIIATETDRSIHNETDNFDDDFQPKTIEKSKFNIKKLKDTKFVVKENKLTREESVFFTPPNSRSENDSDSNRNDFNTESEQSPTSTNTNPYGEGTSKLLLEDLSVTNLTEIIGIPPSKSPSILSSEIIDDLFNSTKEDRRSKEDKEVESIVPKLSIKKTSVRDRKRKSNRSNLSNTTRKSNYTNNSFTFNSDSDDDFQSPQLSRQKTSGKNEDIKDEAPSKSKIKSFLKKSSSDILKRVINFRITENSTITSLYKGQCIEYIKSYDNDVNMKTAESDDNQQMEIVRNVGQSSMIVEQQNYECNNRIPSMFDFVIDDPETYLKNQEIPITPVRQSRYELQKQISETERNIREKQAELEHLKQILVYKKMHNVEKLKKDTILIKKGCQEALLELAAVLRQTSFTPFDMATLLHNMHISHDVVGYNVDLDEFT